MNDIKIVFMGTPVFPVPLLKALIDNYNVSLVVTQPDKIVGRKKEIVFSPVKKIAQEYGIEVFQPNKIKEDFEIIQKINPDLIITCAFGQILPKELLVIPRLGSINVHVSLLPKLRGGAPIHRAILEGYKKTGVTIMYMNEKMDEGDIIAQKEMDILADWNVGILHDKMQIVAKELLLETLPKIINGTNLRHPQNHDDATYAPNITREDEKINFNKNSVEVYNKIRGLNPWPLANFNFNNQEFKVLESYYELKNINIKPGIIVDLKKDAIGISCNDGIIYLTKIKPFGKKEMKVLDYLNGIKKEDLLNKEVN